MPTGLTGQIAAADADRLALQDTPVAERRNWRRPIIIAACGAVAYLLALVATLPARIAFDPGERWTLSGTVWSGEALLAGTHRLEWHWSAVRTLTSGAFAADWRLTGTGSDLAGNATLGRSRFTLDEVSGEADGALLAALAPDLSFDCVVAMQVRIDRLAIGGGAQGGSGRLRSQPGQCTSKQTAAIATFVVPPLIGTLSPGADTTALSLAAAASRRELIRGSLTRQGRLRVAVTRAGVQALPFASGIAIDTRL